MSQQTLVFAGLVALVLAGCGHDPACPVGTTQVGHVCVYDERSGDRTVDAGPDSDGGHPKDAAVAPEEGDAAAPRGCTRRPELCNDADDDCDGAIDEQLTVRVHLDADGDGHGSSADPGEVVCAAHPPEGKVTSHDDCDDGAATMFPGAVEVCDRLDNDCDAMVDERDGLVGGLRVRYRLDCDGDSFLAADAPTLLQCPDEALPQPTTCMTSGAGVEYAPVWRQEADISPGVDCADADAQAFPGAAAPSSDLVAGEQNHDYDCDGESTPALPACPGIFVCTTFPHACYAADARCGESATQRVCSCGSASGTQCAATSRLADVACR